MNGSRVDTLSRSLTATHSRRGAFSVLLGGSLGLLGLAETDAKKKKGGKKGKKGKGKGQGSAVPTAPPSVTITISQPSPPPSASGGAGTPPASQNPAPASSPTCAPGQRRCQDRCISENQCCTNSDCGAGTICENGGCICPGGTPICGETCCTAPVGFTPARMECLSAGGGAPSCSCTYRVADFCAPGCRVPREITLNCATAPDAEELSAFCRELGCESRE